MWIQCHNVPFECMDPSIIQRIGEQVGSVEEIDVGEGGFCVGKYARVRVTRSVEEPLVRCVPLKHEGSNKDVIVVIQYEKLPNFCFLCGRVGHISRDCVEANVDRDNPKFERWLRAGRTFVGKRSVGHGSREVNRRSSPTLAATELGRRGEGLEDQEANFEAIVDNNNICDNDGERELNFMGLDNGDGSSSNGSRDVCMKEVGVETSKSPMAGKERLVEDLNTKADGWGM